MLRRKFLLGAASGLAGSMASGYMPFALGQTAFFLDAVEEIKKLRINSGDFYGGYVIAPLGKINWYFSNLALISIVQDLSPAELEFYIKPYLDLYLAKTESNATIRDVVFSDGIPVNAYSYEFSDSDDSYAATFLSLVARYLNASQNWAWWDANKSQLKEIAYHNLAITVKANSLTSVFQYPRSLDNSSGYLMDNCEVYRGLRDFSAVLGTRGEPGDAVYYDSFASNIASGIVNNLIDPLTNAFKVSDYHSGSTYDFYPGLTCQVFPEAFSVSELSGYYDAGWIYFDNSAPGWQLPDSVYDDYPWAILGYVAAKRGLTELAWNQLFSINQLFVENRPFVTINELGFFRRAQNILNGRPTI